MTNWYQGGPHWRSRWLNPRPLTTIARWIDRTYIVLLIALFVFVIAPVPDIFSQVTFVLFGPVLAIYLYALIFRTGR